MHLPPRCRQVQVAALQVVLLYVLPALTGSIFAQFEDGHSPAQSLATSDTIDFAKQINPLLTKSGCNAGACHGAAAGRGYLSLSLFGSRPQADYEALLFAKPGRYIDLQDAVSSLVIQKPCGYLDHGGGVRIDPDSDAFGLLKSWIESGSPRGSLAELEELIISPGRTLICETGQTIEFSAEARWSDDDVRDATPWLVIEGAAKHSAENFDPESAQKDAAAITYRFDRGAIELTPRVAGYWPITIRCGPLAETLQLWVAGSHDNAEVTLGTVAADWSTLDQLIADANQRLLQPLAGPCPSHLLARRLWLDLAGRHPTSDEWTQATEEIHRGQSALVVDRLLASPEFSQQAADEVAGWIAQASSAMRSTEVAKLSNAIRDAFQTQVNLRAIAEASLRVETEATQLSAFHQFAQDPRARAELIASTWMGVRIGCARCHDHPLDHWTQDDYFAMAACWAEIEPDPTRGALRIRSRTTTDLRTGQPAKPRLPGKREAYADVTLPADIAFTEWLCSPDNPYFARNLANRIWLWLMGTGLVEDVDDHRATNPPINPELLEYLSQRLAEENYSLRSLVREIVLSEAYRRSTVSDATSVSHRLLASRKPKTIRIPLEQLAAGALGVPTASHDSDFESTSMIMMATAEAGCGRGRSCVDPFADSLQMVAGERLQAIVQKAVAESRTESPVDSLAHLHRKIYGIEATESLRSGWQQMLDSTTVEQKQLLVEDILWSWIVTDSFRQLN